MDKHEHLIGLRERLCNALVAITIAIYENQLFLP